MLNPPLFSRMIGLMGRALSSARVVLIAAKSTIGPTRFTILMLRESISTLVYSLPQTFTERMSLGRGSMALNQEYIKDERVLSHLLDS